MLAGPRHRELTAMWALFTDITNEGSKVHMVLRAGLPITGLLSSGAGYTKCVMSAGFGTGV